jgi:hypothetical protein
LHPGLDCPVDSKGCLPSEMRNPKGKGDIH